MGHCTSRRNILLNLIDFTSRRIEVLGRKESTFPPPCCRMSAGCGTYMPGQHDGYGALRQRLADSKGPQVVEWRHRGRTMTGVISRVLRRLLPLTAMT